MKLRQITSSLRWHVQRLRAYVDRISLKPRQVPRVRKIDLQRLLSMDLRELGQQIAVSVKKHASSRSSINFRDMPVSEWPKMLRWTLLGTTFLTAFGLAAFVFWAETWHQFQTRKHEVGLLKARYAQVAMQAAMRPAYQQQLEQVETQFGEMLEMIPASLETVQVLDQVSRAAQASGMRLQWFKPAPEVPQDAFIVMPVDIRLVGSYHAVGHFLEAVSRMKHLITVDVLLEPVDATPGQLALATRIKAYRGDLSHKTLQLNSNTVATKDGQ